MKKQFITKKIEERTMKKQFITKKIEERILVSVRKIINFDVEEVIETQNEQFDVEDIIRIGCNITLLETKLNFEYEEVDISFRYFDDVYCESEPIMTIVLDPYKESKELSFTYHYPSSNKTLQKDYESIRVIQEEVLKALKQDYIYIENNVLDLLAFNEVQFNYFIELDDNKRIYYTTYCIKIPRIEQPINPLSMRDAIHTTIKHK